MKLEGGLGGPAFRPPPSASPRRGCAGKARARKDEA